MERIDNIRKNIYHQYNEQYLESILKTFSSQNLDSSHFDIQNRNISKLLNYFFEDLIFQAKSKNGKYSPQEIIDSDELLCIALNYIDNHSNFYQKKSDVANLRSFFFHSSMVGKVNNFNPVIARKIFERYIPFSNATIFDYSCGFGSRLLGALSSPYHYRYIGVDPYKELYIRLLHFSKWILQVLKSDNVPLLYNLGSEIFLSSLVDAVDLSFSSPPYFNYETYTNSNTQSYIQYNSYKKWLRFYVTKTIHNIFQYTKYGGYHLVNLEDTKRIHIIDDWINIALEEGFLLENIENIPTSKRASSKNENKLIIFQKK